MAELKVVATIVAKAEYVDELTKVFETVVTETRKEEGNVLYDLHRNVKEPLKFVFLEVWKSQDALDAHNTSAHFQVFASAIDGKIDGLEIDVLKKIF